MSQKAISLVQPEASNARSLPAAALPAGPNLVERVARGLKANEFRVAFQPIVHAQTGSLSGVECLLRWQHPDFGLLSPGSFLGAFSDLNIARETSYFVLESACRQLAELPKAGIDLPSHVAINIEPSQLIDDALSKRIKAVTRTYAVDPSLLELELLETEDVAKILAVHEFTRPLKRLGVRFAIDDFGSGYSSLTTLSRMHVDTVKLTRDFLYAIPASELSCTVVSTVLDLFARLGVTSVAEGVETGEQFDWLARHAEVLVQGYYIAPPRPSLSEALARTV